MEYGRRKTDFPKQRFVTGVFYYLALIVLLSFLIVGLYWQLEDDNTKLQLNESEFHSTPANRAFFVPIYFCSTQLTEFTLIRYYHDLERNLYYGVPDATYKTSANGCFDTRVQANTGRLDPGVYEYHVSVSYPLNPIRTIQKKVAVVRVVIE